MNVTKKSLEKDIASMEAQWNQAANEAASRDSKCIAIRGAIEYATSKLEEKENATNSGSGPSGGNAEETP